MYYVKVLIVYIYVQNLVFSLVFSQSSHIFEVLCIPAAPGMAITTDLDFQ